MKKLFCFLVGISFLVSCGSRQPQIDKVIEDGVEVVLNHLEPYTLIGERDNLNLEKLFTVDFERDEFAKIGIPRIGGFNVDSEGNIYVWSWPGSEYFIFKFDKSGEYVNSFGRKGQGPGEIEMLVYLRVNAKDEVIVFDDTRKKIIIFDNEGSLIGEIQLERHILYATPLANGKILALYERFNPEEGIADLPVVLMASGSEQDRILHSGERIPNWFRAQKINAITTAQSYSQWSITDKHIFIGNKVSGYQFLVYDFNGMLVKKIRKEYRPVPVPEEIKKSLLKVFNRSDRERTQVLPKVFFPDAMFPIQYFFTDDHERLYVMTFEKGDGPRAFMYDIFNSEGFFIGRVSLDNSGNESNEIWGGPFDVRARNDNLYCMRAKDSGYQELTVYKMEWTK